MSQILIAVQHGQQAHIVSSHTDWREAIDAFSAADNERRDAGTPVNELYYAVRDSADTEDPTVALLQKSNPALAALRHHVTGAVERGEAEPIIEQRSKRRQTRRVPGSDVVMVSQGDQRWVSEDGEYVIERVDDYETECDHEHPVRIGRQMREQYARARVDGLHRRWPLDQRWAIENDLKGYLCQGGETHFYSMWEVGSQHGPELISRDMNFGDALRHLGQYLQTGEIYV